MDIRKLEQLLKAHLREKGLHLYELHYTKKDSILSVVLDESMDMNALEEVSRDISEFMDTVDEDMDAYLLDVCTAGIERPIRTEDEMKRAVGSYVYVKTKEIRQEGTLEKYEDGVLTLSYLDKNRTKTVLIEAKNVKQMRYAVKF